MDNKKKIRQRLIQILCTYRQARSSDKTLPDEVFSEKTPSSGLHLALKFSSLPRVLKVNISHKGGVRLETYSTLR